MKTKTNRLLAMLLAVTMLSSMATIPVSASSDTSGAPSSYAPQEGSDSADGNTAQNSGDIFSDIGFKFEDSTDITDIVKTPLRARNYTSGDFDEFYMINKYDAKLYGNGKDTKIEGSYWGEENRYYLSDGESKSSPLPADASAIVKTAEGDFGGTGRKNGVALLYSANGNLMLPLEKSILTLKKIMMSTSNVMMPPKKNITYIRK